MGSRPGPCARCSVAAVVPLGARWRAATPFSIIAVTGVTGVAQLFHLDMAGSIADLPAGPPIPSLSFLDPGALGSLLAPAVVVAAPAALESALSASVADGMAVGRKRAPARELSGQGLANIAARCSAVSPPRGP